VCVCVLHVMVFSAPAFSQTCSGGACSVSPDYTVGSNVSANATNHSTSGVPQNISGETILVCGDFFIDQDFTIGESTIVLTEDSKLIIEEGNSFTLTGNTMYGCDGMWQSVEVEAGAYTYIFNSYIYDAYIAAVKAKPGSLVLISSTTFDRNHRSLWVQGPGTTIGCSRSTFYANDFNFNFPDDSPGNNNGKPWIAIDVFESSLLFGNGRVPSLNKFDGPFDYGVRTYQSIIGLENNQFKNLAHQNGSVWEGTAVSSQHQSYHTITGNTFENIRLGVESYDFASGFLVKDNSFKEYTNAVRGSFVVVPRGIVEANEIGTSTLSGHFGVEMHQLGSTLQTTGNTIFVDSRDGHTHSENGGWGVRHSGSGEESLVKDNDITLYFGTSILSGSSYGIYIKDQNGTEILNNNIEIESNGNQFVGLVSSSSERIRIENNRIVADQQGTNVGISLSASPNAKFCCNIDSLMYVAVTINGDCDGSEFASNDLYESSYGLFIDFDSYLGRQELTGNRWRGNFDVWGAIHGDFRDQVLLGSEFVVTDIDQPEGPGTVIPGSNWFIEDTQSDDTPCGSLLSTECGEGPGLTPNLTDLDTLFAGGAMDTIFGIGSAWTHSQTLFSKMKKNPSLYGDYEVTDDWYDDQVGDIVEDYYLVRDTIIRLFQLTTQQQDTVDRALDTIEVYFSQLRYIDSLIFTDTITQWHTYDTIHSEIVGKIDSVYSIYLNTLQNTIDDRVTRAQSLLNTNDNLSTPDLPTRYEKMYNEILLETVASNIDTFTLAQKDSLYIMASACPSEAGRAVYWAGTLYQLIEDAFFDIQDQCDTTSSLVLGSPKTVERTSKLLVIPNPAEDYIELSGLESEALDGIEVVKIYSISGVEVWSGNPGLNRRIAIGRLAPGLYSVLLVTNDREVYRSKFIVQR
jgi:hypothetical protein